MEGARASGRRDRSSGPGSLGLSLPVAPAETPLIGSSLRSGHALLARWLHERVRVGLAKVIDDLSRLQAVAWNLSRSG